MSCVHFYPRERILNNCNPEAKGTSIVEAYLKRTPTSKKLYERGCHAFPGGYTRGPFQHNPYPTYMKRGQGCKIWDVDGNEYLDFVNNYGPLVLGHSHPKVMEAVRQQLEDLWIGAPTEVEIELAETAMKRFPSTERLLFCPTGAEACMKAVRTFRAVTGKDRIAMFDGAFHGASDSLFFSEGIPRDLTSKIVLMPFNDLEGVQKLVRANRDQLAVMMVEPTIGNMGHEPAKGDFYKALREITEENDIPLVFDEIVDGFRIAPGGAQERFGVKSDMSVLGKILGGGFPLAAFASSEEVMRIWSIQKSSSLDIVRPLAPHPGTHNDFKISMAAGLSTINQMTPTVYEHLEKIGEDLRKGLTKICSDLGIRAQVTGISSIFHLHFTDESIVNADSARRANKLLYRIFELSMLNEGINLGKSHSSFLSEPMTDSDIERMLNAAQETLATMKPMIKDIAPILVKDL
jgi:glutamate-1-semialdehyde 2,1-aminomutase